jgi:DNA invertase Pin-like site-specific DNA recombinase
MRAAVYVRLSKEDRQGARSGIESCLVQQKNAERAIESQAWHLAADRVFVDDDESGAEILRRPQLQAMLLAAERRAFDVIVLRDLARLARDAARQAALLVQLKDAGVEVWSYTDRAFVQLDGYGYLLTAVKGVVAEQERAKAAQRIREGLRFRVQAGRRATPAPFGYRSIRDANGAAHWQIDDARAAVVVRIGETFVERSGSFHATAVALNGAGVPSPGGSTWSPQTVKNVLTHPLYRGEYRHGAMRTVARGGTLVRVRAPEAEVLRIAHPELRIWPAALLAQIDAALARPRRKAWGVATPRHLASSFLRCAVCGSSLVVSGTKSRNNLSYVCDKHRMHGRSACRGIGYRAEHAVDAALLRAVAPFIDGDVAQRALGLLKDRLEAQAKDHGRESASERVRRDLDAAQRKSRNLADAIARGGEMDALLVALREETGRIDGLRADLERVSHAAPVAIDPQRILATARKRLAAFSKLLRRGGVEARPVVAAVLGSERLVATPIEVKGSRRWQLAGQISAGYLMSHVVKEASGSCPSCGVPRASPRASRPRRRSPRRSWGSAASGA